jgi:PilZ domain
VATLYHAPHEGKRRWARHKSDAAIRVLAGNANAIEGRCVQVSAGGMCFFALGNFAPGTQVWLEFVNSNHGEPQRVRGTIRNRTVYLYGVEYEAFRA